MTLSILPYLEDLEVEERDTIRLLSSLRFGVSSMDPTTFVVATATIKAVSRIPTWRRDEVTSFPSARYRIDRYKVRGAGGLDPFARTGH